MDELYRDKELAMFSTMYRLQSIELCQGPTHEMTETLSLELRIAKTRLEAVGAGSKLYANCLTIGRLVNKHNQAKQVRWFTRALRQPP